MTIREFIHEHTLLSREDHLAELENIKAPQVVIDRQKHIIENLKNGKFKINDQDQLLDLPYISHESKTGRGGKKYVVFASQDGEINYFPHARYGAFICRKNLVL